MHSNLTRTPTRYPAPASIYGGGWFYVTEKAEHAHKAYHTARGEAEGANPISVPTAGNGGAWRATDGDTPCIVCGRGFTPTRTNQLCCSSVCSRERKNTMTRLNSAQRKAR